MLEKESLPSNNPSWPPFPQTTDRQTPPINTAQPSVMEALSLDRILHSTSYTTSTSEGIESVATVICEEMSALHESEGERPLPGLALSSQGFLPPVNRCLQHQPEKNENASIEQNASIVSASLPTGIGGAIGEFQLSMSHFTGHQSPGHFKADCMPTEQLSFSQSGVLCLLCLL